MPHSPPSSRGSAAPRLPGFKIIPARLRLRLRAEVLKVISHQGRAPDYDHPVGDRGLFGPDSITWKIHADFPSMMAGGLASLMLQALHPLALAGVWDHSNFREDILGRLQRTTMFVGRTTYAPTAPAREAIARVRRLHGKVVGMTPDGQAYSANDPHLFTWVHCVECWCFLRAYEAYCHQPIPLDAQDRYLREMAVIADGLGAAKVPGTVVALHAFFDRVRPELRFDERSREVLRILSAIELPVPMQGFAKRLFLGAGAVLLPDWAQDLLERSEQQRRRDRRASRYMKLLAPSIRDAMGEGGLAWRSCRRTGARYENLFRWD